MPIWFESMLSDNSGGISTMRVVLVLWIVTICFNLTYGQLVNRPFPITVELVTMTACLAGAKAVQRFGEKSTTDSSIEPASTTNGPIPVNVTVQGTIPVQTINPPTDSNTANSIQSP